MKKIYTFLCSMKFGIILLVLIALLSAGGSLIQQGQTVSYYAETYPNFHGIIIALQLDNIYKSWYFITLLALLCINLMLCSVIRIRGLIVNGSKASRLAAGTPNTVHLSEEGVSLLKEHLQGIHCKEEQYYTSSVYSKNSFGRYGTFITHLAILLTVIFGIGALYLPTVTDKSCYPGYSLKMDDGTQIKVNSFRIEDKNGRLDYTSNITVKSSNGDTSEASDVSVNHPFSFKSYKIYQQTYGTAGSLTVTDPSTGASDDFILDDVCFLSADNVNGIWFDALYPGYIEDDDGNVTLITNTSGSYPDPVYSIQTVEDGVYTPVLAFPGDEFTIGGLTFTFNSPIEYPGLRIKHTPIIVEILLCVSFALTVIGLFITFFLPPTLVKVDNDGYVVCGPKPESMRVELDLLLGKYKKE